MQELYKIIVVLVGIILGSWGLFGFFVVRWIRESDNSFKELYDRTRIPTERQFKKYDEYLEKLNERVYDNSKILAATKLILDNLIADHNFYHRNKNNG